SAAPQLSNGTAGVRVRVVDADGAPVYGVEVSWPAAPDAFAMTGPDGVAWLQLRPPTDRAQVQLAIKAPGRASLHPTANVQLGCWGDAGDQVLLPACRLTGRVVDERHEALVGATVFVAAADLPLPPTGYLELGPPPLEDFEVAVVQTNRDGVFRLDGVPAVPVRVWAVTAECRFAPSDELRPDPEAIVDAGTLRCLPLLPGSQITGTVRDPKGRPLSGARIRRRVSNGFADPARVLSSRWFDAAEDGTFTMPARAGMTFELLVEADGYAPQRLAAVVAGTDLQMQLLDQR
ncbi:MAG: carboxypeptidase regulatory-like domain-containing protein, partial [Planctomycetes bacterium]|nr:carboxypeptidase regulatory-like domain-containing protein [Planctomycetota bacterium]